MTNYLLPFILVLVLSVSARAQTSRPVDFFDYNPALEHRVDQVFHSLNDSSRVAQMIVTSAGELGKADSTVIRLATENKLGGIVFLKGTKEAHVKLMQRVNSISDSIQALPLLFSIDAEPSLYNGRLKGSESIINTNEINSIQQCDSIARLITKELKEIGFHQNFAPVVDISIQNEAIKNRSFGSEKEEVIELSKQFIQSTQDLGLVATAKHFPGHGLVAGDTHKKSVYINGDLKELDVYPHMIDAGVLSIMVAHITIENNLEYATDSLPASCSRKIVTDLLKDELGFRGLVITDAMNIMKAVTVFDNAPLLASKAGNDMILMPINETETLNSILDEMKIDATYKEQVYQSVKKIIRLKLFLGLIKN